MAGYVPKRMKRKESDEIIDDFCDFSLSSPATKIRRLDAILPPIMENNEQEVHMPLDQSGAGTTVMEESPVVTPNEERSIVPFNPTNIGLSYRPPNLSVSVDPGVISGIKSLRTSRSSFMRSEGDEEATQNKCPAAKENLAVVPWAPLELPPQAWPVEPKVEAEMDASGMDMEIESGDTSQGFQQTIDLGGVWMNEGPSQLQQQQHCMTPQGPRSPVNPIFWYP